MEMHFINPEELPPGLLDMIRKQHDMHEMSHTDQSHQISALIDELNSEQLITLRMLLAITGGREGLSSYFQGMITQQLQSKFGLCLCGEKHDPSDLLNEEQPAESTVPPTETNGMDDQEEYRLAKMKEYNLEYSDNGLQCAGCKVPVHSLEDRMLRPPGVKGCEGCQHQAKWG